jgi:hypothetical protein
MDGENNNYAVSSSDVMGIFNDSSSLDTSRSILCLLRAGARPDPTSYECTIARSRSSQDGA